MEILNCYNTSAYNWYISFPSTSRKEENWKRKYFLVLFKILVRELNPPRIQNTDNLEMLWLSSKSKTESPLEVGIFCPLQI